jgi:hypothetical protein
MRTVAIIGGFRAFIDISTGHSVSGESSLTGTTDTRVERSTSSVSRTSTVSRIDNGTVIVRIAS